MDAAVNHSTMRSAGATAAGTRADNPWHLALVAAGTKADLDAGVALLRARHGELVAPRDGLVAVHAAGLEIGAHRGAVLAGLGVEGGAGVERTTETGTVAAPIAFLFPGLGDHYLNMAKELYAGQPVFARHVDRCAELLTSELGEDIREIIFAEDADTVKPANGKVDLRRMLGRDGGARSAAEQRLDRTAYAQPALFVVEYALARLWQSLGVRPEVMIGYSLGEYVAATLAGVMSIEDSLKLVARRAKLIEDSPTGSMLAVMLPEAEITPLLSDRVSLSAVNGPEFCVVAGHTDAVAEIEATLAERGVVTRRVQSTHAFHSVMMEPLAAAVTALAEGVTLHPPRIPYISNVTGEPITDEQATDPAYWAKHLCSPVRFADGVAALGEHALLETGPGQTLSSMASAARGTTPGTIVASMRHSLEDQADTAVLLKALARLWTANAKIDWDILPVSTLELPDPNAATPADKAETDRPLTDTERRVVALWARLLPGDSLPVDVSFFELGGNSLLATRLILRVSREFGVELTLRRIYEMSTITKMATAIDALLAGDTEDVPAATGSTEGAGSEARPKFQLPNGMWVTHQNEAETLHFYEDIFDHRTYAKNGISIPDGATVVDVGGNIGLFTLFANHEAKDVRIFTFEPAPPLFEILSRNAADHGANATLFNIGISDTESEATLTFYPRSAGMSSFHPDTDEERHNLRTIIANQQKAGIGEQVDDSFVDQLIDVRFEAIEFTAKLRPLSAIIAEQGIERIDLIKIDVQKCEQQVVDGISDADWPKIQQMVLEAHDTDGRVAHLVELLERKGFTVLAEQDELYVGTDIHNIYATRD